MRESERKNQTQNNVGRAVLVLAERPLDYADDLKDPGLVPIFVSSVEGLQDALSERLVSGFVLEVDTVLRANALDRGHLFQLAEAFPLLRALRSNQDVAPRYLDDLNAFAEEVRGFSPRPARHVPRVPVLLRALLQRRKGGLGEAVVPATLLDISACGGSLNCEQEFDPGEELTLRIMELSDPSPLEVVICWCGRRDRRGSLGCCAGVRFLNVHPGQARELGMRYLGFERDSKMGKPS